MPYTIRKSGNRFAVVKKDTGEKMGEHDTRKQAADQIAAIEANESGTKSMPTGQWKVFTQEETNYRTMTDSLTKACGNCRFYRREGDCTIVDNQYALVTPVGVCDEWRIDSIMSRDQPHGLSLEVEVEPDGAVEVSIGERAASAVRGILEGFSNILKGNKDDDLPVSGFKSLGGDTWLAWWTNNFKDREGELFRGSAIQRYTKRVSSGQMPLPELWRGHIPGSRYGVATKVWQVGHFSIAYGKYDDTDLSRALRKVQRSSDHISHGYLYRTKDRGADGVYNDFHTYEISTLPQGTAANPFTSIAIGDKSMALELDKTTQADLVAVLGKKEADAIIQQAEKQGEALEALGVQYKNLLEAEEAEAGNKSQTPDAGTLEGVGSLFEGILKQQHKAFAEMSEALLKGVSNQLETMTNRVKALEDKNAELQRLEPAPTRNPNTQVDPNNSQVDFLVNQKGHGANPDEPTATGFKGMSLVDQIVQGGRVDQARFEGNGQSEGGPPPTPPAPISQ